MGSFIRKIVILMLVVALSIASTIGKKLSPGWTIRERFWTLLYVSIGRQCSIVKKGIDSSYAARQNGSATLELTFITPGGGRQNRTGPGIAPPLEFRCGRPPRVLLFFSSRWL